MGSDIEFKQFSVGNMDNNVYIMIDRETKESILFDAPTNAKRILAELEGTRLTRIVMTHADGDHIQALQEVRAATGAPVGCHPNEADRLPSPPDFELGDGQIYSIGQHQVRAMFTPGHSPGGMSFVVGDILVSGDTLFPGGPGNTQRKDGDFDQIIESIRTKLFTLPDETRVYPGHGKSTAVGAERPNLQTWIDRGW